MGSLQRRRRTQFIIYGFVAVGFAMICIAIPPASAIVVGRPAWLDEINARAVRESCVLDADALNLAQLKDVSEFLVGDAAPIDVRFKNDNNPPQSVATRPLRCPVIRRGKSSWYGGYPWNGRPTKSGQIFDDKLATAAASKAWLNSKLCVANPSNGKSVKVLINDTGDFAKYSRMLDVSKGVAIFLGFKDAGTAELAVMKPECCDELYASGEADVGEV